jgi:hypothetical protein
MAVPASGGGLEVLTDLLLLPGPSSDRGPNGDTPRFQLLHDRAGELLGQLFSKLPATDVDLP